jgi:hypothetical protein
MSSISGEWIDYVAMKPWSSKFDGYASLAKEIVSLIKNSNYFELSEYEGKGEFYQKYYDVYQNLYDTMKAISEIKSDGVTEVDIKCVETIANHLNFMRENSTLNLNAFLVAYINILMLINPGSIEYNNYDMPNLLDRYNCLYKTRFSNQGYVRNKSRLIIKEMNNKTSNLVPFISPRGTYGINTFLYLYFNNIDPIGISYNTWPVHRGMYNDSPHNFIMHDLGHYGYYKKINNEVFRKLRLVYISLIKDSKLDNDQVKGYIIILFYITHEYVANFNINKQTTISKDWYYEIGEAVKNEAEVFSDLLNGNTIYNPKNITYTFIDDSSYDYDDPNIKILRGISKRMFFDFLRYYKKLNNES